MCWLRCWYFFFFKQKTAYEMRISDWSSDVCSSDLYDVTIIDNLSRRKIDVELGVDSLTPIAPIDKRLAAWKEVSGKDIAFHDFDIADNYHRLLTLIRDESPDVIIHFAEQRAAPYSMKSSWHKRYTVTNNLNATNNEIGRAHV